MLGSAEDEADLKRLALEVALLLPRDHDRAVRVLNYARGLTDDFMHGGGDGPDPPLRLVRGD